MRRRRIRGRTLLCCALALALTGCRPPGGMSEAGPPAGGWPQPEGDRVTQDMCGLLTDADYEKLGHDRQPSITKSVNGRFNTVDCLYKATDELTLTLEPTADYAHYLFGADLTDHKAQLAQSGRRSALVSGVVGAADESWFDLWTSGTAGARPVAHELRLRRGSLLLGITLGGDRGKTEKDPRSVLIALAGLVLRRLPQAGLKDTGTQHKVEYAVLGRGRARIQWTDYTDVQNGGKVAGVTMPWLKTVPVATSATATETPDDPYLEVEARSPNAKVGCLITVDDRPVAIERPRKKSVVCDGEFPADAGGPPSAQPAIYAP
jgi:hypothetical protein